MSRMPRASGTENGACRLHRLAQEGKKIRLWNSAGQSGQHNVLDIVTCQQKLKKVKELIMSKMKKLASVLLALVMALAMTCTAFADTTYTISLSTASSGYAYNVYQIFKGDYDADSNTLSNIEFGTALSETDQAIVLAYYATALATDADEDGVADYESSAAGLAAALADGVIDAEAFAKYIASFTLTLYGTLDDTNTSISAAAGYYLIVNTTIPDDGTVGYSDYILEVVDNLTISPKNNSVPTFDKTVGDEADDDEATEDYAVGDDVEFTLTATLPDSYSSYTTYALTFHDTLSSGLKFDEESVVVKVGDTVVASGYTLVTEGLTDDCSFEVRIADTNVLYDSEGSLIEVSADSVITVTYTAELTTDATTTYQTNTAYLEYSNDPNSTSTGETETDTTYVINFTVTVDKVDEENNALTGAAFALYTTDASGNYTVLVKEFTVDDTTTSFSFDGLAIGDYMLVETTTPAGYNTIDPIYFTIDGEATESTTGVTITSSVSSDDATFSGTNTTSFSTTVINESGSTLPSTGGIGTTIFYIVGGVMVLGAAVLLITRRRMSTR